MRPLICELDGTLLKTDLRSERLMRKAKHILKRVISSDTDSKQTQLDNNATNTSLPINEEIFEFLQARRSAGQSLVLRSDEDSEHVTSLLGDKYIFEEVISHNNAELLKSKFGEFDYLGTERTPLSTWQAATNCFTVETGSKTPEKLKQNNLKLSQQFSVSRGDAKSIFKSLRVYQWLKNLLVFVPIITSQQLNNTAALKSSIIMFFCFSMVASFGYIVNDLLDLQSDRSHPVKRTRPFASGALSVGHGVFIGIVLLALAGIGGLFLPVEANLALGIYLMLTVLYSLYLKTKLMIDVVALGGLFTLRVIGGAAAIESELSFYLLSFSIFIFSSLAMVKRFAELDNLQKRNKLAARGRGYQVGDIESVRIIGISLGYMSVFIMGQYINSPLVTQYYNHPKFIWLLFPLLTFWLGRLWILASRGEVNEDPLIFTIKDTTSLLVVAVSVIILIAAD